MKEHVISIFDEKDLEVVRDLRTLGVSRKVAYVLAYLRNHADAKSVDIEQASGLRQPEVSTAVGYLRKRQFIKETVLRSPKGRPYIIYSLIVSIPDLLHQLWSDVTAERKDVDEAYARLRG